jgi:hypothetical protein
LDLKQSLSDNKSFWKQIKKFFSNKGGSDSRITLVEGNEIVSDELQITEHFKDFFENAVKNLNLPKNEDILNTNFVEIINDPIDLILHKFQFHPSILRIHKMSEKNVFSFSEVDQETIFKAIQGLKTGKASTHGSISIKQFKENKDIIGPIVYDLVNKTIKGQDSFPDILKCADVSPIHKKGDATSANNYRNVSVLPAGSKIYERILHTQLSDYFEKILSPVMCGYRKGYSAQFALVSLIEKFKIALDKKGYAGAIFMDLSKAFDTINHELLIAKLHAYGVDKRSLVLIKDYLSGRKQRVKIGSTYSSWSDLKEGVPQGSVLGPLLFNIYLNDLFYFNEQTDACNFADDTTFYSCDDEIKSVLRKLEHDSLIAIEWFGFNYMQLNKDKSSFIF